MRAAERKVLTSIDDKLEKAWKAFTADAAGGWGEGMEHLREARKLFSQLVTLRVTEKE